MKFWQAGVIAGSFFFFAFACSGSFSAAQEAPGGNADVIRAQLEKLQSTLREIEQKNEQRGKVTEIGSSRGRLRDSDEPRLVVKVYDLSDLFTVAPSYPAYEPTELIRSGELQPVFPHVTGAGGGAAAGGFGGGGGGLFAVPNSVDRQQPATLHQASGASGAPASDVRTSMQSLIDTITSTIDPDGWADVGGPSTVAPVGSSLLISTTSETHAKLTALIDLFRQRWGSLRTISVQAHWLWLSPAQIDEVLVQPKPGAATSEISLNTVTPGEWKKLLAAAAEKEGAAAGYHSIVTCYNGQTVATQAGAQRIVVTGITPVVAGGQQAAVAYTPVTRTVHEGATLQITPLATRHVKYVVLDVHSRVNLVTANQKLLEKVEKVDSAGPVAPRQVVDALDRVSLQTQRLETTLRVPVGQPTLIGGMTFTAAEGKSSHLYLFITTKVQELRDDEPTAAPATPKSDAADAADEKPKLEKK